MSKRGNRYTPEFRYQMVQLVRSGRDMRELTKEFGVSIWSIRNWVKQAARDAGTGDQGLTSLEREELTRLKHEVRQLRQERAPLLVNATRTALIAFSQKPRPGLRGKTSRYRSALRIRDGQPGRLFGADDVSAARRIDQWFLRVGGSTGESAVEIRFVSDRQNSCDPPPLERSVRIADDSCGAQ